MTKRLRADSNQVLYGGKLLCICFDTNLCGKYEAAEMLAALFNAWLDKQEAIHEEITKSAGD